jgi:chromosome segregation ATPase
MKKDVNFVFFGLLILLLIAMIGVVLYNEYISQENIARYTEFKKKYEKACEDLNRSYEEINIKDEEIREKEQALIDIINELNLSKQRASSLGDYYETVRSEKDTLEEDLNRTEDEMKRWKSEYVAAKQDLGVCEKSYALKKSEVELLNSKILTFQNYANDLSGRMENLTAGLEIVMDDVSDLDCNASSCKDDQEDIGELVQFLQEILAEMKDKMDKMKS